MRIRDLTGNRFNLLEAIAPAGTRRGGVLWLCRCACGRVKRVASSALLSKTAPTKSCGCLLRRRRAEDLRGAVFGKLTVTHELRRRHSGGAVWACQCLCGRTKNVSATNLKRGSTKSCGCSRLSGGRVTHGQSGSRAYNSWKSAKQRCFNTKHPAFHNYGARGILMCPRWRESFSNFFADMGERPAGATLERRNNSRGYAPGNCVWAPASSQLRNTRSNNVHTFRGKTMCVAEWAERAGLPYHTVWARLRRGWPLGRSINQEKTIK